MASKKPSIWIFWRHFLNSWLKSQFFMVKPPSFTIFHDEMIWNHHFSPRLMRVFTHFHRPTKNPRPDLRPPSSLDSTGPRSCEGGASRPREASSSINDDKHGDIAVVIYMVWLSGWWYTYPSEKYESEWEGLSHIYIYIYPIYYENKICWVTT